MTNKDKVIAAFLVSLGLFSVTSAMRYVGTLSEKEKAALLEVSSNKTNSVYLCSGTEEYAQDTKNKTA